MENDLIREVVRFEEELNRQVAAEAERSRTWLEEARTRLEVEFSQRQQALEQESTRALATARDEATLEAEATVRQAETRAEELEGIDQKLLKEFIRQHISAILPGRSDDHPDVEG